MASASGGTRAKSQRNKIRPFNEFELDGQRLVLIGTAGFVSAADGATVMRSIKDFLTKSYVKA
jgi:hypothetical protein